MTKPATSTRPSVKCQACHHSRCTGRATQGHRVAYSSSNPCPCDCHDPDRHALAAHIAKYGYQIDRENGHHL